MTTSPRLKRRLDLNLDSDLKKRLLVASYEDQRTMADIVEEALIGWFAARDHAASVVAATSPERAPLPVQPPVRNAVHPEVRTTAGGARIPVVRPLPATHPARRS